MGCFDLGWIVDGCPTFSFPNAISIEVSFSARKGLDSLDCKLPHGPSGSESHFHPTASVDRQCRLLNPCRLASLQCGTPNTAVRALGLFWAGTEGSQSGTCSPLLTIGTCGGNIILVSAGCSCCRQRGGCARKRQPLGVAHAGSTPTSKLGLPSLCLPNRRRKS